MLLRPIKKDRYRPGLYYISDDGRVFSTFRGLFREKLVSIDYYGYFRAGLSDKSGKTYYELVSRLVASPFIDNPNNLPQVNHIDSNRKNNKVENLEWVSNSENLTHYWHLSPDNEAKNKQRKWASKLVTDYGTTSKPVPIIGISLSDSSDIRRFRSMAEAARNGFNQGHISLCISGKRNKHKGFRWIKDKG